MTARSWIILTIGATVLVPACAQQPRVGAAMSSDSSFPTLSWEDVPDLLARSTSTRVLTDFPRSPWSSQYEETCSEGMLALWLLEGVRQGGRFASLNALCFSGKVESENWSAASESNHERVRQAYQDWWSRVEGLPRSEAAAVDPLEGTGLHWH